MMRFQIRLLFSFIIFCQIGFAQTLLLPHELGDKRRGKQMNDQIAFYAYPFQNENIDLRDFKKRRPDIKAPDFIKINGHDLMGFYDLTVLIGIIEGVEANENAIVIWLAANYTSNNITFFLDRDLDRNFAEEEDQILKLSSTEPAVRIDITPERGDIPQQEMWLKVPHQKVVNQKVEPVYRSKEKSKIINKFAIGAHLGVGVGSLAYRYDNLERGFPTWYNVNLTEKSIGASFSYNLRHFRLALTGNYQNIFTYTSYLNVRFDEPETRNSGTTGRPMVIENVLVDRNLDKHTTHHFQYAATLGIRIHPTKGMEFQPFFSIGQINYLSGEYSANRYQETGGFNMPSTNFYEMGLRIEFVTVAYQAFYLDLIYQRRDWGPEGFFERIPHENLEVDNEIWKMTFGYRFGL